MSKNDKSDQYVALGARLKFLREQWQQSINDVSSTLEIDEKLLRAYEEGKVAPTPETLDMLINHFLLTEDQAQDLRELAGEKDDLDVPAQLGNFEEMLAKQLVMLMPMQPQEGKVIYTDSMQVTVNDNGVILQFMQAGVGGAQPVPVSRLGMSREHAEKIISVLQDTFKHHDNKDLNSAADSKSQA